MRPRSAFALPLAAALAASLPAAARAQESDDTSPPPPATAPSPEAAASASAREYPTPLAQRTQRTYVPQSVALSGPRELTGWSEGEPVPDGYHPETRIRRGLVIGGAVTFGSVYLLNVLAASVASDANKGRDNPAAALFVPCVGPFLYAGQVDSAGARAFLVVDGLAQTAGAVMLIYGLASPRSVLVRNDLGLRVSATPMRLGQDGSGLGVVGTF